MFWAPGGASQRCSEIQNGPPVAAGGFNTPALPTLHFRDSEMLQARFMRMTGEWTWRAYLKFNQVLHE